jgi:hypothetical protein
MTKYVLGEFILWRGIGGALNYLKIIEYMHE